MQAPSGPAPMGDPHTLGLGLTSSGQDRSHGMDKAKLLPQCSGDSLLTLVVECRNRRPIGRASDAVHGIIERRPGHLDHLGLDRHVGEASDSQDILDLSLATWRSRRRTHAGTAPATHAAPAHAHRRRRAPIAVRSSTLRRRPGPNCGVPASLPVPQPAGRSGTENPAGTTPHRKTSRRRRVIGGGLNRFDHRVSGTRQCQHGRAHIGCDDSASIPHPFGCRRSHNTGARSHIQNHLPGAHTGKDRPRRWPKA